MPALLLLEGEPKGDEPDEPLEGEPKGDEPDEPLEGEPKGDEPDEPLEGEPKGDEPDEPLEGEPKGDEPESGGGAERRAVRTSAWAAARGSANRSPDLRRGLPEEARRAHMSLADMDQTPVVLAGHRIEITLAQKTLACASGVHQLVDGVGIGAIFSVIEADGARCTVCLAGWLPFPCRGADRSRPWAPQSTGSTEPEEHDEHCEQDVTILMLSR